MSEAIEASKDYSLECRPPFGARRSKAQLIIPHTWVGRQTGTERLHPGDSRLSYPQPLPQSGRWLHAFDHPQIRWPPEERGRHALSVRASLKSVL
jgi:hypothetical protein